MREIKFRGKRIDTGEWVYGDLARRKSRFITHLDTTYGISCEFGTFCAVDPNTISQHTGLKDKNGVEIYEGDVLNIIAYSYDEPEDDWHGEVVMGQLVGLGLIYRDSDGRQSCSPLWNLTGSYVTEYYVCGNIHDNPNLLEGRE